jgi:lipoprotein-anchoring transpeptidase ErfK/SrfK
MNTWKILAPVSAAIVLSAVGCASSSQDASTDNADITASDRCAAIAKMTDDDAQAAAADAYETQNPTAYEACRKSLADNAPTLDEFLKWATPDEIDADMTDDPTEAAPSSPTPSRGTVNVSVSIANQRATIEGGGLDFENVQVATGRPGYPTVRGCYNGFQAERNHWSTKYHAAMPYTVFFYKGEALHQGNVNVRSHGCVHLTQTHAAAVYNAYKAGYTVHVCIQ